MAGIDLNTRLMLHFDGANDSTTITDSSWYLKAPSAVNHAKISTAQSKFGGSSLYLDGTDDYVTIPADSAWFVDGLSFCVDCWIRPAAASWMTLFAFQGDTHLGLGFNTGGTARNLSMFASSNGSDWGMISGDSGSYNGRGTVSIALDTWTHVAMVRNGNNWRTYINGTKDIDITVSSAVVGKIEALNIGRWGANCYFWNGYIDEFRWSRGVPRWTGDFTPETSAYSGTPPTPESEPIDTKMSVCLHFDDGDGATTCADSGRKGHSFTCSGHAKVKSNPVKMGAGAGVMTGGNSGEIPASSDWTFAGDFCIEFWLMLGNKNAGYAQYILDVNSLTGNFVEMLYIPSTDEWSVGIIGAMLGWGYSAYYQKPGEWHHYAITRSGSTIRFFIDGVQQTPGPGYEPEVYAGTINAGADGLILGAYYGDYNNLTGAFDEVRISNVARYTSGFTPSTTAFTTDANTKGLWHLDTDFTDSSGNGHTITAGEGSLVNSVAGRCKFGLGALDLDGNGDDFAYHADHADFEFGTQDFTLECWGYLKGYGGIGSVLMGKQSGTWPYESIAPFIASVNSSGQLNCAASTGVAGWDVFAGASAKGGYWPLNKWCHFAATREGSTFRLFLDGCMVWTGTSSASLWNNTEQFRIGAGNYSGEGNYPWYGYIDEAVVTMGLARYTADFFPPQLPYYGAYLHKPVGIVAAREVDGVASSLISVDATRHVSGPATVSLDANRFIIGHAVATVLANRQKWTCGTIGVSALRHSFSTMGRDFSVSRNRYVKPGWHLYDVTGGVETYLGFIADGDTALSGVSLSAGEHQIEVRGSQDFYEQARTTDRFRVVIAGGGVADVESLPAISELAATIENGRTTVSWRATGGAATEFRIWLASASPVSTAGDPDRVVGWESGRELYSITVAQTAAQVMAIAAVSDTETGASQELALPWPAGALGAPGVVVE